MPRVRRPAAEAEVERRLQERGSRLGGQIRALRARRQWSQQDLGDRAALGRLVISRLERGVGPFDVAALERLGLAFGVPLRVEFGRDPREDIADAGHLAMQELLLRTARHAGYSVEFELPTRPAEPWRSIDVGLANPRRQRAIAAECWNTIGDVGAASRSSARKRSELDAMWSGRWGEDAQVGLVWVVRATKRNRLLVERYPEVFRSRFPGSSRLWVRAIVEGTDFPPHPGLIWCDVAATRLFHWRRADGRIT